MYVMVTGAAGFIGAEVSARLLAADARVLGVDNLNSYYPVSLKEARLARLRGHPNFRFVQADISDREAMTALSPDCAGLTHILNLAAQAGVRYSLVDPYAYVQANVMGFVVMAELARQVEGLRHFVYASSSSVYGSGKTLPFSTDLRADEPDSLYAATKRADEMIARTYAHLYRTPTTGLRFFTVYGPWGRPDMAPWMFTQKIIAGEPITVFNNGEMWRDFTYVDDIVDGVLAVLDKPPGADLDPPHRVYNLGNNKPEKLAHFVEVLQQVIGKRAVIDYQPMQPGDVPSTYADIEAGRRDFGFAPKVSIEEGLARLVDWYRAYHGV